MAWSDKNNLDVDKYRNKVIQDLEKEDSDWHVSLVEKVIFTVVNFWNVYLCQHNTLFI